MSVTHDISQSLRQEGAEDTCFSRIWRKSRAAGENVIWEMRDYVVFNNNANYKDARKNYPNLNSNWNREITIKTGTDQFDAWGMTPSAGHTAEEIVDELRYQFNAGLPVEDPNRIDLADVPGFASAYFINIPKVAQMIFNERTDQTTP